ncbi:MAG: hypothetical protein SGARI_006301, partial [Bacillariaceae sp.]
MGSQQSSPRENSHDTDTVAMDIDAPSRLSGRKRPRSEETTGAEDTPTSSNESDNNQTQNESTSSTRASKRRRLLSPIAEPMNKALQYCSKKTAFWFIKFFFLNFLEMATLKSKPHLLAQDVEIRDSIISVLALMQDEDFNVFRRGWRALCICTDCEQRPGQLPARANALEDDIITV